jgi:hypothetical protein
MKALSRRYQRKKDLKVFKDFKYYESLMEPVAQPTGPDTGRQSDRQEGMIYLRSHKRPSQI